MSFNLCPYIIMEDLLRYINICTTPQDKLTKSKWKLFDEHYNSIVEILKIYWYRNVFIESLVEQWIIDSPMLIYSPWRTDPSMNSRLIEEWLYVNKTWHIFYDPLLFKNETKPDFDNMSMGIKLPDLLTYAILSHSMQDLCYIIKPFLS